MLHAQCSLLIDEIQAILHDPIRMAFRRAHDRHQRQQVRQALLANHRNIEAHKAERARRKALAGKVVGTKRQR